MNSDLKKCKTIFSRFKNTISIPCQQFGIIMWYKYNMPMNEYSWEDVVARIKIFKYKSRHGHTEMGFFCLAPILYIVKSWLINSTFHLIWNKNYFWLVRNHKNYLNNTRKFSHLNAKLIVKIVKKIFFILILIYDRNMWVLF